MVSAADEKKEIVFADVGWDSIELNNAIAGLIAEEVFGYTWSEVPGSTPITHEALMNNEIDVHMEEWTDNITTYQEDLSAGKFTELGVNFDDNYQGLYIPAYVAKKYPDLKTVKDLAKISGTYLRIRRIPGRGLSTAGFPDGKLPRSCRRRSMLMV